MKESTKKVIYDFVKGLIPLVTSLLGGLLGIYLGDDSLSSTVAIGSILGGLLYSAC